MNELQIKHLFPLFSLFFSFLQQPCRAKVRMKRNFDCTGFKLTLNERRVCVVDLLVRGKELFSVAVRRNEVLNGSQLKSIRRGVVMNLIVRNGEAMHVAHARSPCNPQSDPLSAQMLAALPGVTRHGMSTLPMMA